MSARGKALTLVGVVTLAGTMFAVPMWIRNRMGGALTANTQMLRDNNMLDRYPAIIDAMGEVVRRGVGKPPWKQLIETLSL